MAYRQRANRGHCYTAGMVLPYVKMSGTGNRILVVDNREAGSEVPSPVALRRLGDEATGPGFDQLMWLTPSERRDAVAAYRVFNRDGTEVEQCGNGLRCVAHYLGGPPSTTIVLVSPAGRVEARFAEGGRVSVNMGEPSFDPADVPFTAAAPAPRYPLEVDGETVDVAVVSLGNPHCVVDVPSTEDAAVVTLGPAIEAHPRFPERVNVGFRRVRSPAAIDLRVYERGVGETLACGTGACAAVVTARREGLLDPTVGVRLPGGELVVSWRGPGHPVWLSGDVTPISEGTIDV